MTTAVRPRDRDAVIQSLRAGVVPRVGQYLIQVGRKREIETLVGDIERVADGGSTFRLVIGDYGAGKTFFLNLVRAVALEKRLVVASADLNPDRRLQAKGGQARSLFAELMRNVATRNRPEGGALSGVVERFVTTARAEAKSAGVSVDSIIRQRLDQLSELVNGYDFAEVIAAYYRGFEEGDEQLKADAVRWLRGEFNTRTEARQRLGVRAIVDDSNIFDQLKLMARFTRLAGFSGLLLNLDEMVNLYKLSHTQSRNANYEQILRILNDSLQGTAVGLGFILGGTPQFLSDPRRGLYSYPALQSRLAQNSFAVDGLVDLSGPVLNLTALTPEEYYLLLNKVRHVYAYGKAEDYLVPDEALTAFMKHCEARLGNDFFRTPRTTITAFIDFLAVLDQNPGTQWRDILGGVRVDRDEGGLADLQVDEGADDELASFRL